MSQTESKLAFFGCALDPDERQPAMDEKIACLGAAPSSPYEEVLELIRAEVEPELWSEAGQIQVPDWLLPVPPLNEAKRLIVDDVVEFIDSDGCRDWAKKAGETALGLLPAMPCMLAVDHSLAGGVMAALAGHYGKGELSVIIVDAHSDAVPMPALAGAIAYDMDTNPDSLFDPTDPFLRNRSDSFNASSFVHHLLSEGAVLPQNLYLLANVDHPPKRAARIKDSRMKAYTRAYNSLQGRGVGVVTNDGPAKAGAKLAAVLKRIKTPYVYVSIDMDAGAGRAVDGVRFNERQGLDEAGLYKLAHSIRAVIERGVKLAGLDVCEFNARTAGRDRTYRVAANLIEMLAWGMAPRD